MTLPDKMDKQSTIHARSPMSRSMGHLLMLCLKRAVRRNGVNCGVTACAQLLKSNARSIMFCLLPAECDQLSMQIHQTLIKAFCHERNIPLIPITNVHHLQTLITKVTDKARLTKMNGDITDMSCVLVQYPVKGTISKYDRDLLDQYQALIINGNDIPAVDVPA